MKKFITLLILISFLSLNYSIGAEVDDLVKYLDPNLKIKIQENIKVEDELLKYIKPIEKVDKNYIKIGEFKIKPSKYYSTKQNLKEGDYIDFCLAEDIKINSETIKKGTIVKGRIENISQNLSFGVPADIVIDNFKINDMFIEGSINKQGADRSLWVYPLSYFLMSAFCIGILFMPIRGGHAKLKPKDIYIIGE